MGYVTPPKKFLHVADAAYLAGLIDGEGSIALWRGFQKDGVTHTYRPVIEISNTHKGVLEWVAGLIGAGWFACTNKKNAAEKGHKELYRFRFRTTDLHWVLPQVRPYLKIKGEQADLLLEYFETVTNTRPKDRSKLIGLHAQFAVLNRRGLP